MVSTVPPARPVRKDLQARTVRKALQAQTAQTALSGALAPAPRITAPASTAISGWMWILATSTSARPVHIPWSTTSKVLKGLLVRKARLV
jgi:hypothetical protein